MSRLDSFIRRLLAQRACIDLAAQMLQAVPGPVIELGLGNGRTYDHLRERFAGRDIYVFERTLAAHPDCIPPARLLLLGDFSDTLPGAGRTIGEPVVFAHLDVGSGDSSANAALAATLAVQVAPLMAPGALVASDQDLGADGDASLPPGWRPVPPPDDVEPGRYFLYACGGPSGPPDTTDG